MPLLLKEDIPLQEEEARPETGDDATGTTAATREPEFFKRFLELPVPVVLLTLWLVGVVLIGFCAMALYDLTLLLVEALAEF
jgi:hypothetical protein